MNKKFIPKQDSLAVILSKYDITNFTFKECFDGVENTTVFVFAKNQNFVLRVYRLNSKTDEQIQTEIDFIYFLRENDFLTPDIFANNQDELLTKITIDNQEWQIILMEKIYATPVAQNDWIYNQDLFKNMAQTHAKLHLLGSEFAQISLENDYEIDVKSSGIGKILSDKIRLLRDQDDLSLDLKEIIGNIKSLDYEYNAFLPLGFIHDDIDWNNLLLDEKNDIYVIDFGDLRLGPLVSCLGSGLFTVILSSFEKGDKIQKFAQIYLDFYKEVRHIENEELPELFKPIILNLDLYIATEILSTKTLNSKIQNFIKLKNEISNIAFTANDTDLN